MAWWVILVCAKGYYCGIENPIAKLTKASSVEQCKEVGKLAIDLAHYNPDKFKIICAKEEE